jgi:glucose/arabinose dehydrogenase
LAASGLSNPTALAFMPDGRMLVTEKGGDLVLVDGGVPSTLVTIPVCSSSEMGLLASRSTPTSPATAASTSTGRIKARARRARNGRVNEVVRVTMAMDDTVSIGSLVVLLTGARTDNGNHDGGVLRMGPDDKLYVGVGDTGLGDNRGRPGLVDEPILARSQCARGKSPAARARRLGSRRQPFVGMASTRGRNLRVRFSAIPSA